MNKLEYDFATVDPTDYELIFTMSASSKVFNQIFNSSRVAMIRKGKNLKEANPDTIDKFDIPERFFNFLGVILSKNIKGVASEVAKDKIIVLSNRVTGGCFERDKSRNWQIKIKVGGEYVNKQ